MAKKLIVVSLALVVASALLPWHYVELMGVKVTMGALFGDEPNSAYLILVAPTLLACLLGLALGARRFGRAAGIVTALLSALGALMIMMIFRTLAEEGRSPSMDLGAYAGILATLLALGAGLIGAIRPEPRE